jgi:hypothetical protein
MAKHQKIDLFKDVAPESKQHPIYRMLKSDVYAPERAVLINWSKGFQDRDGKFCYEFQTSFEPCLWELYLYAYLKEIEAKIDFSFDAPDFVVSGKEQLCIEATIAAHPIDGLPPYGNNNSKIPEDLNLFNSEATLRICNSFSSKVKKYRKRYSKLPQVSNKPFVIAIASFDRPQSQLAANRPVISALYGLYHDEETTIATKSGRMVSYNVDSVTKNEKTNIDLGYFCTNDYTDISAVIYSCLATWGKIRALAHSTARSIYTSFYPNPNSIYPIVKRTPKSEYYEHLLDGLYVFHNPFAKNPINLNTLGQERLAQGFITNDGELDFVAPEDFLLLRFLNTINTKK